MKFFSILIFTISIMATIIGALLMLNNIDHGKQLLMAGTATTWLSIVLVIYYWVIVPRKK